MHNKTKAIFQHFLQNLLCIFAHCYHTKKRENELVGAENLNPTLTISLWLILDSFKVNTVLLHCHHQFLNGVTLFHWGTTRKPLTGLYLAVFLFLFTLSQTVAIN